MSEELILGGLGSVNQIPFFLQSYCLENFRRPLRAYIYAKMILLECQGIDQSTSHQCASQVHCSYRPCHPLPPAFLLSTKKEGQKSRVVAFLWQKSVFKNKNCDFGLKITMLDHK